MDGILGDGHCRCDSLVVTDVRPGSHVQICRTTRCVLDEKYIWPAGPIVADARRFHWYYNQPVIFHCPTQKCLSSDVCFFVLFLVRLIRSPISTAFLRLIGIISFKNLSISGLVLLVGTYVNMTVVSRIAIEIYWYFLNDFALISFYLSMSCIFIATRPQALPLFAVCVTLACSSSNVWSTEHVPAFCHVLRLPTTSVWNISHFTSVSFPESPRTIKVMSVTIAPVAWHCPDSC